MLRTDVRDLFKREGMLVDEEFLEELRGVLVRTDMGPAAAEAMRCTSDDLKRLKLIDGVIAEPLGGAHRDKAATIAAVGKAIATALAPLTKLDGATLISRRRAKFLEMGRDALV